MPIDLDYNSTSQDWPKAASIDLPEHGLLTEETFRAWMQVAGVTPERLRSLPLYSAVNRARYPWLERVASGA